MKDQQKIGTVSSKKEQSKGKGEKDFPTLKLIDKKSIALDFATKVSIKFDKLVKSIILFGSQTKQTATPTSDIDMIIVIDDAAIQWDQELVAWYREELGKTVQANPYRKELHLNTIKLTTWWQDMMRGDPVIINVLRFGEPLVDLGGFFSPLKILLQQGKIKSTPEAIYTCLQRTPVHLARSKSAKLSAIEGIYWTMVDASHAALMAAKQSPPSPEHISQMLTDVFVTPGFLKGKYVSMYKDLYLLHRKIIHGDITDIKGQDIDEWQKRAEEFLGVMVSLVKKLV